MATSKLLLSRLRRCFRSTTRATLCHLFHAPIPTEAPQSSYYFRPPVHFFHSRSVDDLNNADGDSVTIPLENNNWNDGQVESRGDSVTIPLEIVDLSEGVIGRSCGEESILPVRALISLLDAYMISLASLVPPPFPPPLSGRSFIDQISHFQRERRAIECPSFLWFLASFSIQGGTLWFQNLTEFPHGVLGAIFPVLIAGLHYTNTQISFRRSSLGKESGFFGLLAKLSSLLPYYKLYLYLWTVPLLFVGYYIPQGSLVYWVTNSSFSIIQQLSLKHPAIRSKLWLPDKDVLAVAAKSGEIDTETNLVSPPKRRKISVKDLTRKELLALSAQYLTKGQKERAIPLLQLALDKDPDYIDALIVMGQTHLQKGLLSEAVEYLECAISKLFLAGHPTEPEDVDLLIVASQWTGVAYAQQGKWAEGIVHLERIGNLNEPEEPRSKAHYFDGLVMLSSVLSNVGCKTEAAKYLHLAAAYNPEYNDDAEFVSDISSSRRRDY